MTTRSRTDWKKSGILLQEKFSLVGINMRSLTTDSQRLLFIHKRRPYSGPAFEFRQKLLNSESPRCCSRPTANDRFLFSRSDFGRRSSNHFCSIKYRVRSQVCRPRSEKMLLAVDQIGCVERGQLKSVAMRNRVCGACLDTISTKDTAVVVNVVNLGIALGAADPVLVRILRRFNVNAISRTIGSAEKTRYTLLKTILVTLQDVPAAISLLETRSPQWASAVRVVFDNCRLEHLAKGNAHSLDDGGDVFEERHSHSVYQGGRTSTCELELHGPRAGISTLPEFLTSYCIDAMMSSSI